MVETYQLFDLVMALSDSLSLIFTQSQQVEINQEVHPPSSPNKCSSVIVEEAQIIDVYSYYTIIEPILSSLDSNQS